MNKTIFEALYFNIGNVMVECKVTVIEAFDLDYYPGWCKAVLKDSDGDEHILVDKLPVIGVTDDEISKLPLEKFIRVEIINDLGNIVEITTEKPDGIETEDGESHFMVFKDIIKIE